ncbi:MAG TPA: CotH kinase family protein [Paludibacteraceae bacterium]|jgi:hypothetical protein|nr:CotH kinase family protein [Paludibacteraceae bacterium]HOU67575.1 CotH kinase family protein [Paludibacteraceae bacterium]HPH62161.1 CotH kinase family protein [Paludibacteraceae bacterium]HQF49635.1 CotH kinase family protein [Paludibacteraceae bacterium]
MKKSIISFLPLFLLSVNLVAQDSIYVHKTDGSVVGFSMSAVDTMISTTSEQKLLLSYPENELKSITFPSQILESEVNLDKNDKPQSFNLLKSISFNKLNNADVAADFYFLADNSSDLTVVLPTISDFSALASSIVTTGSYVYLNGKLWAENNKMDFSKENNTIKVVAFNGDVRTYNLIVKNSGLPILKIQVPNEVEVGSDWSEFAMMNLASSSFSNVKIKGKGSHYKSGLKNSYNLKFEDKTSLLDIVKNKRWMLIANDADKTLMRSALAYNISSKYLGFDWTPNCKPVEFVLNGQYLGSYFLTEQVRVCDGRVENGYVLSIEDSADEGDDSFVASASGKLFVMKDPETGSAGAGLVRSQTIINQFESVLFGSSFQDAGSGYRSLCDINSFVDWFLINEIAKNEEAFFSDTYQTITEQDVLKMGPVSDMEKAFGISDSDTEGFVSKTTPWMSRLFEDPEFAALVKSRFAKIYAAKSDILNWIDTEAAMLQLSAASNDVVWNSANNVEASNASYQEEVKRLKTWLEGRLNWLNEELQ